MSSIGIPAVRERLLQRLAQLTPTSARRWGSLTSAEMLSHLGDAGEAVLGTRIPPGKLASGRPNRILKWVFLYSPVHFPKGIKTRPGVDPRQEGTAPAEFASDRERVVRGLSALAAAQEGELAPHHFLFGPMSCADWHRWAYRHVDHHLRQFGL